MYVRLLTEPSPSVVLTSEHPSLQIPGSIPDSDIYGNVLGIRATVVNE
jgi:hypothetical protein